MLTTQATLTKIAWNLSGLTIILFDANQWMAAWRSFSKVLISSSMVFSAGPIVGYL